MKHSDEILKQRAVLLAQELEMQVQDESLEVIEFSLSNERYAADIAYVSEVSTIHDLAKLPCVPEFIAGLINIHGRIFTIIDLRPVFGLPHSEMHDQSSVIILNFKEIELGLYVDSILGLRKYALEAIQPGINSFSGIRAEYLKGVTSDQVALMDLEVLMTNKMFVIDQEE